MGRSQRHLILEQNAPSNGEASAQGQPAPVFVMQVKGESADPEAFSPSVLQEGSGVLQVPVGPSGGPLAGSTMSAAIPVEIEDAIDANATPSIASLFPEEARLNDPNITMHVHGTNFTEGSVIYFANQPEPIVFISSEEITTGITLSLPWGEVTVPVWVEYDGRKSTEMGFNFLPAAEAAPPEEEGGALAGRVDAPRGPLTILRIEDHEDGIQVELSDASGLKVDGMVLIEATGNTNVNGSYEVWSIDGNTVIVNNDYTLDTPIEGKGRLTVTDAN
jgi:hypothetical protein